jgi:hypothetical protein
MLCSVTVSIGEETKGVLRVMRLVTAVSRVTSEAGKPEDRTIRRCVLEGRNLRRHTNVARQDEEVIVGQTTVLLGVDECLDVDSIALGVVVLEHLKGFGEVQCVSGGIGHGVAVQNGHFGEMWKKIIFYRDVERRNDWYTETDHSLGTEQ